MPEMHRNEINLSTKHQYIGIKFLSHPTPQYITPFKYISQIHDRWSKLNSDYHPKISKSQFWIRQWTLIQLPLLPDFLFLHFKHKYIQTYWRGHQRKKNSYECELLDIMQMINVIEKFCAFQLSYCRTTKPTE